MTTQIKLEFVSQGFKEILESDGVKGLVESATETIKQRADSDITGESEGFSASVYKGNYGGGRWVGMVHTTDYESKRAESEDKSLTKAVR